MPLGSRIQSERVRRFVVALIMLGVLGASVSAAMLLSRSRQAYRWPTLHRIQTQSLSLEAPRNWRPVAVPAEHPPKLQPLAVFKEPGIAGRTLAVYEFENSTAVAPDAVLRHAGEWLTHGARVLAGAMVRSSTMLTRIIYGDAVRADQSMEKLVLGASTLDGKTYLVLHLSGPGPVTPEDLSLLRRIAQTAEDLRFEQETGGIRVGPLKLTVPRGLHALRRTARGDDDPLLITPTKTGDFRLLKIGDEPLTDVDKLLRARGQGVMPAPLSSLVHASASNSADARLIALLGVRYWQATGQMPPAKSMRPFKVDGRVGLAIVLSGERSTTYRALWAVRLANDQAVVFQLVCEAGRVPEVQKDALLVLQGMGMQAELPTEEPRPTTTPRDSNTAKPQDDIDPAVPRRSPQP